MKKRDDYHVLAALKEINYKIAASDDLKEIFKVIAVNIKRIMPADRISIALYDRERQEFYFPVAIVSSGEIVKLDKAGRIPYTDSALSKAVETKKPVLRPNLLKEEMLYPVDNLLMKKGIYGDILLPLLKKSRVIGALNIESREKDVLNESFISYAEEIATQAAIAIDRHLLIEDIRNKNESLNREKEFFSAVISNIDDGILVINRDYTIVNANDAARRFGKYTLEEIIGNFCYVVSHNATAPCNTTAHPCPIRKVFETGKPEKVIHTHLDRYGNRSIIEIIATPIRNLSGEVMHVVEVMRDVTERKILGEEVIRAKEELEYLYSDLFRKTEEMEDFIFSMTHDLKSPVVSIYGFTSAIYEEKYKALDGEAQFYLDRILKNTQTLEILINDLLDYYRIGRIAEEFSVNNIYEIISGIVNDMRFNKDAEGVEFVMDEKLPSMLCQGENIKRLFYNLIENAVKYKGKDNTRPLVEVGLGNSSKNEWLLFVRDNGIGISQEYLDRIFNVFIRITDEDTRGIQGTGIGLSIARKIALLHSGRIWAESKGRGGSVFYVSIPKQIKVANRKLRTDGLVLLLIDHQHETESIIKETVKKWKKRKVRIYRVDNKQDALAFVRAEGEYSGMPRPDIILIDKGLPGNSSMTILKEIKMDDEYKDTPIILMGTTYNEEEVAVGYAMGCNSYMAKPIEPYLLREKLNTAMLYWGKINVLPLRKYNR